jgi:nitroreductase
MITIDPTTELWSVEEAGFPHSGSPREQVAFLVRYAVLAPSSHNTQPWEFRLHDEDIDVYADLSRWLRVADSDQRELYVSVGCALENLVIAAEHFGFAPRVDYVPNGTNAALAARVCFSDPAQGAAPSRPPDLFHAIPRRHTNRGEYDGRTIAPSLVQGLRDLALEEGVAVHFADDPEVRRQVDALTLRADALQFADPEWRQELAYWLGQGVFGTNWLTSKAARFAVSHLDLGRSVTRKDHELLQSASIFGLVSVERVDRESRIRAGQVFERLFLAATHAGLALQPMNQILQVPEVLESFEALLPRKWGTPQVTFRLGYALPETHSPRRSLRDVLH